MAGPAQAQGGGPALAAAGGRRLAPGRRAGQAGPGRVRRRLEVAGVVQGVGFRPFVHAAAAELGLAGSVGNTAAGLVIEVEGDPAAVAELSRRVAAEAPALALIESVRESDLPVTGARGFVIAASDPHGPTRTLASPDVATCADCLAELRDPANRRFRHPFITCTHCGPRYTVTTGLPFDRATTTMAGFPLCAACAQEYVDPADRRFHAQTLCCPDCGPRLRLWQPDRAPAEGATIPAPAAAPRDDAAIRAARALLTAGQVVAVKGIGGYHLACDARDAAAVATLRARKRRGAKPFAVMARDLDVVRSLVTLTAVEEDLLTGPRRPVVLLPRRGPAGLLDEVAPGSPDLGVMLPYSPLHALLLGLDGDEPGPDVLVMTSGNLAGEPLATGEAEARERLAGLADAWLEHDRPIRVPCDDAVSRVVSGVELPVRRSRGAAPLPLALPFDVPPTLAAGADLKNTCALAEGRRAWVSQHVGDLDDLATVQALTATARHLEELTGVRPERLVADEHPGYRSAGWARDQAAGRPVHRVQHHHAHVAAVMGEHGLARDAQVVGVAFDGTGYGTDAAVWGGEVLVAGYGSFRRAAHLGYVPLAGGDAAVRRPYRMALAHLTAAGLAWADDLPPVRACPPDEARVLRHQLDTGLGCVPTSSMGRLFDAVSSLVGLRHTSDFEAEAAVALEGAARAAWRPGTEGYRFDVVADGTDGPLLADPGPVVRAVAADVRAGRHPAEVAARFHAGVAALVGELCRAVCGGTGLGTVVLGGGVFGNALLLAECERLLAEQGLRVLRPRVLPPNDGGLALGQVLVAAARDADPS